MFSCRTLCHREQLAFQLLSSSQLIRRFPNQFSIKIMKSPWLIKFPMMMTRTVNPASTPLRTSKSQKKSAPSPNVALIRNVVLTSLINVLTCYNLKTNRQAFMKVVIIQINLTQVLLIMNTRTQQQRMKEIPLRRPVKNSKKTEERNRPLSTRKEWSI